MRLWSIHPSIHLCPHKNLPSPHSTQVSVFPSKEQTTSPKLRRALHSSAPQFMLGHQREGLTLSIYPILDLAPCTSISCCPLSSPSPSSNSSCHSSHRRKWRINHPDPQKAASPAPAAAEIETRRKRERERERGLVSALALPQPAQLFCRKKLRITTGGERQKKTCGV